MKKQLLVIVSIMMVSAVTMFAQPLKNPGFELWIPQSGPPSYEDPQDWQTMNILSNMFFGGNPLTCFKSTDKHTGNYAMNIQTVKLVSNPLPSKLKDTTGGVFTGIFNLNGVKYGYADSTRVGEMKFWAKYTPVGNDTAWGTIILQKHNPATPTKPDTVAVGYAKVYGTVSTYTEFTAPVTYLIDTYPDTITVLFASSGLKKAQIGSSLLVDDVSYTIAVGVGEKSKNNIAVNVFPNPANSIVNFSIINTTATSVQVYDLKGSFVTSIPVEAGGNAKLNVQNLANGIYTYRLLRANNEIVTTGKFTVEK